MGLLGVTLTLLWIGGGPHRGRSQAESVYTRFHRERRVVIRGYASDAMEPFLTKDGRFLLFNNRNASPDNTNLLYAKRRDDLHFDFRGEIRGMNTAALEAVPSLDKAGRLYFVSDRDYEHTLSTLYRGRFVNGSVSGVELVSGVSRRQRVGEPFGVPERVGGVTGFVEGPTLSADGRRLYYHKRENGHFVIDMITRQTR